MITARSDRTLSASLLSAFARPCCTALTHGTTCGCTVATCLSMEKHARHVAVSMALQQTFPHGRVSHSTRLDELRGPVLCQIMTRSPPVMEPASTRHSQLADSNQFAPVVMPHSALPRPVWAHWPPITLFRKAFRYLAIREGVTAPAGTHRATRVVGSPRATSTERATAPRRRTPTVVPVIPTTSAAASRSQGLTATPADTSKPPMF